MKRKKTIKLILILLVLNLILSLYNSFTNIQQTESIKFNEKLYDVFIEKAPADDWILNTTTWNWEAP